MMKFKFVSKDKIYQLPKTPGVYAFLARRSFSEGGKKDARLLYIGKATNIKERVKNHFSQPSYRDNFFINKVEKIGFIKTDSEVEALILEANLIKKYQPKYNVMWRDDKNYFYGGITKENYPRVLITHQPTRDFKVKSLKFKVNYIGPFVDGRALKQALKILRKVFSYRSCKTLQKKPCLWYQLKRCPAPCLLRSQLSIELPAFENKMKRDCQENVKNIIRILQGKKTQVVKDLKKEMKLASVSQDFERAAEIRDQIEAIERVLAHSRIFNWIEPENLRIRQSPNSRGWKKIERGLKKILKNAERISRIEAYDVSNIQGKDATGSMVTFVNGQPDKNFYRRFKIKIQGKPNDVAMLKEILSRRLNHPEWGWPDLILIDGGVAQLNVALGVKNQPRVLIKSTSGVDYVDYSKKILAMALAKKENKLFIENQKEPILLKKLPREIFNLILQLRDEAHRFAISYHQKLREKF